MYSLWFRVFVSSYFSTLNPQILNPRWFNLARSVSCQALSSTGFSEDKAVRWGGVGVRFIV